MQRSICAAGLAFLGFGLSLIIGLHVGNPFITVVTRSLQVMIGFYVLGLVIASLGHKVIEEHFDQEKERRQQEAAVSKDFDDDAHPEEPEGEDEPITVSGAGEVPT